MADIEADGIWLQGRVAADGAIFARLCDRAFHRLTQGAMHEGQWADPEKGAGRREVPRASRPASQAVCAARQSRGSRQGYIDPALGRDGSQDEQAFITTTEHTFFGDITEEKTVVHRDCELQT